jgi:class 3 adenylate cyclase
VSRAAEATFLFADIAGFTALAEAHGDEHAVQLVEGFANAVQAELSRVDGEYVKTVGARSCSECPTPPTQFGSACGSRAMR